MHDHSEKIEPKKLAITIILAILLLGYAYMTRNDRVEKVKQESSATSTSIISQ